MYGVLFKLPNDAILILGIRKSKNAMFRPLEIKLWCNLKLNLAGKDFQ